MVRVSLPRIVPTQVIEEQVAKPTKTISMQPSIGATQPSERSKNHCKVLQHVEDSCRQKGIEISYLDSEKRLKATAGTILQRCLGQVERFRNKMSKTLCVYKLGLTTDPVIRFEYYKEDNYTHMRLLHVTSMPGVAQMLEASLIAFHMSERPCRNERFGGDGPPGSEKEPYHFVYIVGARADGRKSIR